MAEEEFEIPSAHEHALEHEAHHGPGFAQQVAIFTAILATIGAIVSFLGGHTQNEAIYLKNEAVLKKAAASDQWAFYQAKGIKEAIAEQSSRMASLPSERAEFAAKAKRYASEKEAIAEKAKAFDAQSAAADKESLHALNPHQKLSIAMTFLQIAIALASIAALTRKHWLLGGAGVSALAGIVLAVLAYTLNP